MASPESYNLEGRSFTPIARLMEKEGLKPLAIKAFRRNYTRLLSGESGLIDSRMIFPVQDVANLETLIDYRQTGEKALKRAVMVKLNGGLGTSMGLDKAKSLLIAKDGLSFLDIIVKQLIHLRETYDSSVPLVLMNSFRTESDTLAAIAEHDEFAGKQGGIPLSFLQNKVPKIKQDDFLPVAWPKDRSLEWCPPGHGDIYTALVESGLLEKLLKKNYRYAFVSNSDNLGATMDSQILGYFVDSGAPFLMEVANRTEADKKGGHLARSVDGGLVLREVAQCPSDELEDFQDVVKWRYFNTNTLWLDLAALKQELEKKDNLLELPLILNSKTVDPTDDASAKVFQLETAMGAAISSFPDAEALRVPRSRFTPVKKTDDLLVLWSDVFVWDETGEVRLNHQRREPQIVIRLDPRFYKTVKAFQARFPCGVPSLIECKSLTIYGDIRFGRNVKLQGTVQLNNDSFEQLVIEDNAVIEGS